PDTLDLDFFYKNVSRTYKTYGVAIYEDNPLIVKPIQKNFHPTTCFDTNLRSIKNAKLIHFFPAPLSTAIVSCICKKYHTKFIAENNKTYNSSQDTSISPTTSNKQIKRLIQQLNTTQQTIPPSPSSQHKSALTNPINLSSLLPSLHIYICPKCDIIKEGKDYYHSSYIANTSVLFSTIASNQTFLQQQLEQTHNTSTSILNTSTTKSPSNISLTNTTSLSKQQQNSNLS
ncbi:24868_t:CDS:2, partial [Gigaspora rosea]